MNDKNQAVLQSLLENPSLKQADPAAEIRELIRICKRILNGDVGQPPMIFGIELHVELMEGRDEKYPVVVYHDSEADTPLFKANIPAGTSIPVSCLWRRPETIMFNERDRQRDAKRLFAIFLATRPEMKMAYDMLRQERIAKEQQEERQEEARRKQTANNLAADLLKGASQERPSIPFGVDFLQMDYGYFRHTDGVVLQMRTGRWNEHLISVVECPKGHELAPVKAANVHAKREHLKYPTERDTLLEGRDLLEQTLRVYVRRELRAVGAMPAAPVVEATPTAVVVDTPRVDAPSGSAVGEAQSQDSAEPQVPVVATSKPAAKADVNEVLGDLDVLPETPGRRVPAKKATSKGDKSARKPVKAAVTQSATA